MGRRHHLVRCRDPAAPPPIRTPTADGGGTRFPFIELMNEVWRVLRDGDRIQIGNVVMEVR